MKTFNTNVNLKTEGNLPLELVQKPLELSDILLSNLPFIITVLIVITAATVTYRSNNKSVQNQSENAKKARDADHQNKISEFRHAWLQEVRENGASLCQIIHEIQSLIVHRNIAKSNSKSAFNKEDEVSYLHFQKQVKENYSELLERRAQYYKVSSKLKLLFKKDDPLTSNLFSKISEVNELFYNLETTSLDNETIESIVEELQVILKEEWEVTKKRKWANT